MHTPPNPRACSSGVKSTRLITGRSWGSNPTRPTFRTLNPASVKEQAGEIVLMSASGIRRVAFLIGLYMASLLVIAAPAQAQLPTVPAVDLSCTPAAL